MASVSSTSFSAEKTTFSIIAAASFCHMLNDIMQSLLTSLYPLLKENYALDFVQIGLLTMTDILESIAGELPDASEVDGPDIVEEGGAFVVSGALNLSLVQERIGFDAAPTEDYQTLAGLVMSLLDRLPVVGDQQTWNGWQLSVVEVAERRVTRVRLSRQ